MRYHGDILDHRRTGQSNELFVPYSLNELVNKLKSKPELQEAGLEPELTAIPGKYTHELRNGIIEAKGLNIQQIKKIMLNLYIDYIKRVEETIDHFSWEPVHHFSLSLQLA